MNFEEDYQHRIEIRIVNKDFAADIGKAAMNTVGKTQMDGKKMTPALLKRYLISEHSPIRTAILETMFLEIYSPSSVHFARHVHSIPFVTTSREDRTGKERSLGTPVNHLAHWNLQALIDMMRKRLCIGSCSQDTYNWAKSLKLKLMNSADPHLKTIGEVLVPNCIYRFGCPEFKKCMMYKNVFKDISLEESLDIAKRYSHYNRFISK